MAIPEIQEHDQAVPLALQPLALGLGMDVTTENKLQKPDVDFLMQMASLPIDFTEMPKGTDVEGMRSWINNVFLAGELAKRRNNFAFDFRRPRREIKKDIITINTSDSEDKFDLWVYRAAGESAASRPAILMFHGGGWIHGNPAGDENIAKIFVSELGAVVFGVDYRLAPEYKFPKPLLDCAEALDWVVKNASSYGIDTSRIALWGASAGGNLAAALALRWANSNEKLPGANICLVSLVVPVTAHPQAQLHFTETRPFPKSVTETQFSDLVLTEDTVREFEKLYELYMGTSTDPYDPLLSPLMAKPDSNFPPTDITVAACDGLRAQGQAFAELLRQAGVVVTEDVLPGVPHTFTFPMDAKVARSWLRRQVDVFEKAFTAEL